MAKRITYKDINEKFNHIENQLKELNLNLKITKSDMVNFLLFRINEINENLRTMYSSFWQKFSIIITLIYAIISLLLATAIVAGIDVVVDVLRDSEFIKMIIGFLLVMFFLNILIPIIVRTVSNLKERECLNEYEDVLSKILFKNLSDKKTIVKQIEKIEEKFSSDLTAYTKHKLNQEWIKSIKSIKKFTYKK